MAVLIVARPEKAIEHRLIFLRECLELYDNPPLFALVVPYYSKCGPKCKVTGSQTPASELAAEGMSENRLPQTRNLRECLLRERPRLLLLAEKMVKETNDFSLLRKRWNNYV